MLEISSDKRMFEDVPEIEPVKERLEELEDIVAVLIAEFEELKQGDKLDKIYDRHMAQTYKDEGEFGRIDPNSIVSDE